MSDRKSAKQRMWLVALPVACGLMVGLLIVFATPHGLGTSPDSAVYLGTAVNFLNEGEFTYQDAAGEPAPMTHYPPLYPVVLAAVASTGLPLLRAAALANMLTITLISAFTALIIWDINKKPLLAVAGAVFVILSSTVLEIHLMAWSEPLFLASLLFALYFLQKAYYSFRWRHVLLGACAISLATLSRYVGVVLLATGILFLAFSNSHPIRKKVAKLSLLFAVGSFPLLAWFARNYAWAGEAANRQFVPHLIGSDHIVQAVETVATWLLPGVKPTLATAIIVVTSTILLAWYSWGKGERAHLFVKLSGFFTILYFGFLIASISFFDAYTPLDGRILSPVYVIWLINFLLFLNWLEDRITHLPLIRLGPLAIALTLLVLNLRVDFLLIADSWMNGRGYQAHEWRNSQVWDYLEALPAHEMIVSNAPDVIYLYLSRYSTRLPTQIDATTQKPNEAYESEMGALRFKLQRTNGVIVFFTISESRRWYLPDREEARSHLPLQVEYVVPEAAIFSLDAESMVRATSFSR